MSGSSLDGLDLAMCSFSYQNKKWFFNILYAKTVSFPEELKIELGEASNYNNSKLNNLDIRFGKYIGKEAAKFIHESGIKPVLIASHGHTIKHEPENGFSLQIGNGLEIVKETGIMCINDFRNKDIKLGGQGAPLVPIGDKLLFGEYDACMNIGGIANISFEKDDERIAFDICGANQMLNAISKQTGRDYDHNGEMAILGKMNVDLFNLLNSDDYFSETYPKSLSNQYVKEKFTNPSLEFDCPVQDKLYTVCKHIAYQTKRAITGMNINNILLSGGGTKNKFLTKAIQRECLKEIIIPGERLIDFKEALIFAFMGVLRFRHETNCLSSVTGASRDCSGGTINLP